MDHINTVTTTPGKQFGAAASTQIKIATPAPKQHRPQFDSDHIPFNGNAKELRAIALRESALDLLARHGYPAPSVNPNKTLCSAVAVPFGREESIFISLSLADEQIMEVVEAHPSLFPYFMKYGLNIWAGKKVFNLEWDESGTVDFVNFTRGPWEDLLIALAEDSL